MRQKIIMLLMAVGLFAACSSEDDLEPSGYEQDLFNLENLKDGDNIDKARYQFWKETGIAVFFNDTIGTQERTDAFGKKYIHYQTLSFVQSLGMMSGDAVTELMVVNEIPRERQLEALEGLSWVKSDLLPILQSGGTKITSLYLVDELRTGSSSSYDGATYETLFFKGLNTIALARASQFNTMSVTEKNQFKADVAKNMYVDVVMDSKHESLIEQFRAISVAVEREGTWAHLYNPWYYYWNVARYTTVTSMQDAGFLGLDPDPQYNNMCLPASVRNDVMMYIGEIMSTTEAEFNEKWGSYPRIMQKAEIIRSILKEIGAL